MPPKKKVEESKEILLGRPGNNLKVGHCACQVKDTLANKTDWYRWSAQRREILLLQHSLKIRPWQSCQLPICHHVGSIESLSQCWQELTSSDPEEARIPVPDERFDWLCELYKPKSQVPAFLTCIDIAGLTAGASTGAGLGNAFLSHVRAVDGIFQVVRAFDDAEVIHVEGDVDPLRDMQIISTELRLKDIEWVEKALEGHKKEAKRLGNNSLADKAKKEEAVSAAKLQSGSR
jgi:obg-like ATPase 1